MGVLAAAERAIAWTMAGGVESAGVHPPTMVLPVMAMPVETSLLPTRTHVKNLPAHTHAHTCTRRCAATVGVGRWRMHYGCTAANRTRVMSEERVCSTAAFPKAASPCEGIAGDADAIIPVVYVNTLASAFKCVARYDPCGGCMRGSCKVGGTRYNVCV